MKKREMVHQERMVALLFYSTCTDSVHTLECNVRYAVWLGLGVGPGSLPSYCNYLVCTCGGGL